MQYIAFLLKNQYLYVSKLVFVFYECVCVHIFKFEFSKLPFWKFLGAFFGACFEVFWGHLPGEYKVRKNIFTLN